MALQMIPPFLGAYWGLANILLISPVSLLFMLNIRKTGYRIYLVELFFLIYILYFLFVVGFAFAKNKSNVITTAHLSIIIQFVCLFMIFRLVDFHNSNFKTWNLITWHILSFLIVGFAIIEPLKISPNMDSAVKDNLATYQSFGFVYLVVTVITIVLQKNSILRVYVFVIAIFCLFINGSRSDILAMGIGMTILEAIKVGKLRVLLTSLILAPFFVTLVIIVEQYFPYSRGLLIFSLQGDNSLSQRLNQLERGLAVISNNYLTGDYASYKEGEYIHNILSAWVDLGLIGFLYYIILILFCSIYSILIKMRSDSNNIYLESAICFFLISIILLAVAKTFTYLLVPISIGLLANSLQKKNKSLEKF